MVSPRGRDGKIVDWLEELTAGCPKEKSLLNMNDRCGAKRPQSIADMCGATGDVRYGPSPQSIIFG